MSLLELKVSAMLSTMVTLRLVLQIRVWINRVGAFSRVSGKLRYYLYEGLNARPVLFLFKFERKMRFLSEFAFFRTNPCRYAYYFAYVILKYNARQK